MGTNATPVTISPLLAMTILTCISMGSVTVTLASDLSSQTKLLPVQERETPPPGGAMPSADSVAEGRWALVPRDYVLGDGGQIIPQQRAVEPVGVPAINDADRQKNNTLFDSASSQEMPECGPSPATPAEITRLVIEAAQRHNVDVGLAVAVVTAESRLDRIRNSPKGARGPMQLMPETAERFGVSDICDPEANIDGGVRYLRELNNEFRNPLLVAAAYNAGEGRVRQHSGIPPFKETLGYVAEVLNIQLGLKANGSPARERQSSSDDPQQPSHVSGVITAAERRQWIGGVMHF